MPYNQNSTDNEKYKFYPDLNNNATVRVGNKSGDPLLVELTDGNFGDKINQYDEITLASGNTATIVQYTVPASKTLNLELIEFSGENIARFFIEIDGVKEAQKRTYFASNYSGEFLFNKLRVDENILIRLRVENFRPSTANFDGRILGELIDKS